MTKNFKGIKRRDESESVFSVQEAVSDFLVSVDVKRLRPKTQEEYRYVLTTFAQWCAGHSLLQVKADKTWKVVESDMNYEPICLHQVNDHVVHLFLKHLEETHVPSKKIAQHLSSHTLAQYVKDIKRFLNWCLLDDLYTMHVQANVVLRIKKPSIEETIIEAFTPEQIAALFKACDKEESEHLQVRDRAIVALLLDTGLRATELCTLSIGNVNLDPKDSYIRVFGKGRKWGEIGLGEQTRRYLQKYLRTFREPTIEHDINQNQKNIPAREMAQITKQHMQQALVFVGRAGKPMTRSGLQQLIVRLGEWASVEGVRCSPHTFRHTFAAMFMRNGGDIYKLSKLLRHSSVQVTEDYLKSLKQSFARKGAKSVLDDL